MATGRDGMWIGVVSASVRQLRSNGLRPAVSWQIPPEGWVKLNTDDVGNWGEGQMRYGLEKGNIFKYSVTGFIYAASDDVESAWLGYAAATTDEGKGALKRRDILVAWRGTIADSEWFNNVNLLQTSASA
ncbi:hypothetical protein V6N13_011432 [Hibiscus sabdariffa]|uniref:Phospholipase A1 n=1 Tax=Hibiscus sabdariffa TaxID=183260 RepID=A0ABR2SC87_9ROSI